MNIAIFGTGNMATGLAVLFTKAGHTVTLVLARLGKAQTVAARSAPASWQLVADAASACGAIVLAVPYDAAADVVEAAGNLAWAR